MFNYLNLQDMKRVFIIVRITRWEKRIIVTFESQDDAINERKRLMNLYPSANYLIEECDYKQHEEEEKK